MWQERTTMSTKKKNRISEPIMALFNHGVYQKPSNGTAKTRFAIMGLGDSEKKLALSTIRHMIRRWHNGTMSEDINRGVVTVYLQDFSIIMDFFFIAMDDVEAVKKYKNTEFTGAFVTETVADMRAMMSCVTSRVGRVPAMRDGGPSWQGVIGYDDKVYYDEIRANEQVSSTRQFLDGKGTNSQNGADIKLDKGVDYGTTGGIQP